jgi:hypothetical protein
MHRHIRNEWSILELIFFLIVPGLDELMSCIATFVASLNMSSVLIEADHSRVNVIDTNQDKILDTTAVLLHLSIATTAP